MNQSKQVQKFRAIGLAAELQFNNASPSTRN
jgi:hypothetical protein